ncbi:MAG: sigma-70 family RNA polymerase sigma factor [Pseudomonadota bacterium]
MLRRDAAVLTPAALPDFTVLYQEQFAYAFRTLRRLGVHPNDLEDLAHEVFVVVYRRLADYDATRPIRGWLFGIAYRVAAEYHRRGRGRRRNTMPMDDVVDDKPTPDAQLVLSEERALVIRALEALDLDKRAVFVMHDIDGQSAPEIAATLAIPLNTVYSRLRLARAKFEAAVRAVACGHPAGGKDVQ